MQIVKNSLGQSHDVIKRVVCEGDTVIDATAGNGNDTVFLAELVGNSGRVYSFDVQKKACDKTLCKLMERGLSDRVTLIEDGHENMDRYLSCSVKAVMFNLGYLPGGDHNIGTRAETTIAAIRKSMELIEKNGIISIVVYYGGDSGFDEKDRLMDFIREIDFKRFTVLKSEFVNQPNCPPIFVCIEKYA
jgi:hypothetical protein